jgi:putative PEP-CTERM system histidine kinase
MFLGAITLGERVTGTPFSWEDVDLLKTIAHQTAGMLLNLNLFERLRKVRETETIQTMASFMVHDLKNLGSMLSLTMQNLSVHFDNPEFQKDALTLVQDSVSKIEDICHRLSMVGRKIELHKNPVDLNEVVVSTLSKLNGLLRTKVFQDLHPLPRLVIDSEQIGSALTNLLLNANEAIKQNGEIRISTERKDGWIILAVSDTGCGISRDFMKTSLFKPFHTTKKKGMGIGLYHSRRILEAHQGQIEVFSQEDKGSTFRLMFPMT